jgi:hypothetical protein
MHSASRGECAIRRMFVMRRLLNSRGIVIILVFIKICIYINWLKVVQCINPMVQTCILEFS